jgi:hypothetical protein
LRFATSGFARWIPAFAGMAHVVWVGIKYELRHAGESRYPAV